jgi:hypothetical protein
MNKSQLNLYLTERITKLRKNGENMFGLLDLASIGVIFASFVVIMYNIRLELKIKV